MSKAQKEVQPVSDAQNQERLARQRQRSIALALGLGALVVMFYILTIVKMGPEIFSRAL